MKKIIDSIECGDSIASIIELKNGYEARVGRPTKLTLEEENFPNYPCQSNEEKSQTKNTNILCKESPRLCLVSRFVYQKISDHYLIMEESGSGTREYSEPIKILEPDLPKKKVKEICLELLINEASKQ